MHCDEFMPYPRAFSTVAFLKQCKTALLVPRIARRDKSLLVEKFLSVSIFHIRNMLPLFDNYS